MIGEQTLAPCRLITREIHARLFLLCRRRFSYVDDAYT